MKKLLFMIFIMLIKVSSLAQVTENIDKVINSVVFIKQEIINEQVISGKTYEVWLKEKGSNKLKPSVNQLTGSGFIVIYNLLPYLVTANHIAKYINEDAEILMSIKGHKPINIKLKDIALDSIINWFHHDIADISILPLEVSSKIWDIADVDFISSNLTEKELMAPLRQREVNIIGFPLNLGVYKYFSPISIISKPASGLIDLPRADTKQITTFFLLSDPSVEGFSGSPVFELPGNIIINNNESKFVNVIRIVGLIHGTISDETGGKFAAVTPSYFISESFKLMRKFSGKVSYPIDENDYVTVNYVNGKLWDILSPNPEETFGSLKKGYGTLIILNKKFEIKDGDMLLN